MSVSQAQFSRAILDPQCLVPAGLVDPAGRRAGNRFAVYRNNVAVSLVEALAQAFPILERLVGAEFFRAMASVFVRQHPPNSPLLMFYGQEMPAFLEHFPPVVDLPYLPDIARLELGLRQSYHAADAPTADLAELGGWAAERLTKARLGFAPSAILIRSGYPIFGIWQQNVHGGPAPTPGGEDVLIVRKGFDPRPLKLAPAQARLVATLMAGQPLGTASTIEGGVETLAETLPLLFANNAISNILGE